MSADEHNPRPSWPCVDEVQEGNSLYEKGGDSQEEEASDARDKAPQQRADPFSFATHRIPKSDGQRADHSFPSEPISARKVPQHDVASYALPGRPNRQLTKRDLGAYDFKFLNAIESIANSYPYLGNAVYRNDLTLDNEHRTSTALTCFFLDGEVAELQPGFNLLRDERAWERVPNTAFFNAIRMAWNNFSQRATYNQGDPPRPATSSVTLTWSG